MTGTQSAQSEKFLLVVIQACNKRVIDNESDVNCPIRPYTVLLMSEDDSVRTASVLVFHHAAAHCWPAVITMCSDYTVIIL